MIKFFIKKDTLFLFIKKILSLIAPYSCVYCGSLQCSQSNESNNADEDDIFIDKYLCKNCTKKVVPILQDECCKKCGYPMIKQHFLDKNNNCHSCQLLNPQFKIARSCYQYKNIIRKLLLNFKYYFQTDGLMFMCNSMVKCFMENYNNNMMTKPDIVCCIPITKTKFLYKTFNHSMYLARYITYQLNSIFFKKNKTNNNENILFLPNFLIKAKKTRQSKLLNQKQRIVSRHFFEVNSEYLFNKKKLKQNFTILLIDDIMTTGGTLNEATYVIKKNFPKCNVECLTFARTMLY